MAMFRMSLRTVSPDWRDASMGIVGLCESLMGTSILAQSSRKGTEGHFGGPRNESARLLRPIGTAARSRRAPAPSGGNLAKNRGAATPRPHSDPNDAVGDRLGLTWRAVSRSPAVGLG